MNLLLEGDDLEALLIRAHQEGGTAARIMRAQKIRRGGFLGFFAREGFEVAVEIPENEEHGSAPSETAEPESLLDLAERASRAERAAMQLHAPPQAELQAELYAPPQAELQAELYAPPQAELQAELYAPPEAEIEPAVAFAPIAFRQVNEPAVPDVPEPAARHGAHAAPTGEPLATPAFPADRPWPLPDLGPALSSTAETAPAGIPLGRRHAADGPDATTEDPEERRLEPAHFPENRPWPLPPAPSSPPAQPASEPIRDTPYVGTSGAGAAIDPGPPAALDPGPPAALDHGIDPGIGTAIGTGDAVQIEPVQLDQIAIPRFGRVAGSSGVVTIPGGATESGQPVNRSDAIEVASRELSMSAGPSSAGSGIPRATTIVPRRRFRRPGSPFPAPRPSAAQVDVVEEPDTFGTPQPEGSPYPDGAHGVHSIEGPDGDGGGYALLRSAQDVGADDLPADLPGDDVPADDFQADDFQAESFQAEDQHAEDPPSESTEAERPAGARTTTETAWRLLRDWRPGLRRRTVAPEPLESTELGLPLEAEPQILQDEDQQADHPYGDAEYPLPADGPDQQPEHPAEHPFEHPFEDPFEQAGAPVHDQVGVHEEPTGVAFAVAAVSGPVPAEAGAIHSRGQLAADRQSLRELGVPAAWTRGLHEGDRFSSIVEMLAPLAEPRIADDVGVVAVVGPAGVVELEAHRTALDLPVDGRPRPVALVPAQAGPERQRAVATSKRVRPVVISIPIQGYEDPASTRRLIASVKAEAVIAVVDADRSLEEITRWVEALERVDAIALDGALDAENPAAVLALDVPVIRVDGIPVDRIGWAALLCAQLAAADLAGRDQV